MEGSIACFHADRLGDMRPGQSAFLLLLAYINRKKEWFSMYSPQEIAENFVAAGRKKAALPTLRLFVLALMAGSFIALAAVGASVAPVSAPWASLGKLLSACVFPAGLAMVLLTGSELFTGNCLMVVSAMEKEITWRAMLRNWVLVYVGNFAGAVLVAAAVVYGGTPSLFGNALGGALIDTAAAKLSLSFGSAFLRGMLCNFLVCIAVWIAAGARDIQGKVLGLFFPIALFVLCGYEHSIANMFYVPAGIFAAAQPDYLMAANVQAGALSWSAFLVRNLLPVTLGNIAGGAGLVGFGFWFVYKRKE